MKRVDELLRETVAEMTTEVGPPAGLARSAMVRGRRIRLRRQLATAAGAVLVAAAIVTPLMVIKPGAGAQPASGSSPSAVALPSPSSGIRIITEDPQPLAGGWLVAGVGALVLDRPGNRYVDARSEAGDGVLPAPAGDLVLVRGTGEPHAEPRLRNLRTGASVQVDTAVDDSRASWSPSGDRLLITVFDSKDDFGVNFGIVDAASGKLTKHRIDGQYDCSLCEFVWTRDGREVAMAIVDRSGGEGAELVKNVQLFDATTGAPTRSLPIKAVPTSAYAWSPDGRYVIATPDRLRSETQIIDLSTGQARPFPYPAVWVTDELLLAVDRGAVLTLRPDGSVVETAELGGALLAALGAPGLIELDRSGLLVTLAPPA